MKTIKTPLICITVILVAVLLIVASCGYQGAAAEEQLTNEDFIRLHVVANSDSDKDQALKLKVRDHIIDYVNDEMVREAVRKSDGTEGYVGYSIEESRAFITDNLDEIVDVAEKVISEEGYDYDVNAEFGVSWIPQKTYGSVIFPAGNYEALKILIGEASGRNWWCVLYPPLCLIDTSDAYKMMKLRGIS